MTTLRAVAACALVLSLAGVPLAAAVASGRVSGWVRGPGGAPVPDASVSLLSPLGAIAAAASADASGVFRLDAVPPGSYVLAAGAPGFATRRLALRVEADRALEALEVELQPEAFREEVTVTATPGRAAALEDVAQSVNVIGEEAIALRAKAVLAQVASEEVGLHLQRTSPTIGGVFVRGLTGTKVNVYVDGVRYTTSAQRGGISTFFDMVDPEALEGIEVVRGPSSAEYGSDALGGTVQLLTRSPVFSPAGRRVSGSWNTSFGSADASFGSALVARYAAPTFGLLGTLAGRRVNTLRPGGGTDSHNAVTRFFDLPSSTLVGERLPDTAFTQYGGHLKANWAITPTAQFVASYLRGQEDGGKRYDQLLGGDGNLVADLRNLMADHLHVRFEKAQAGLLDRLTLAYSFSAQREERVNQGGNGNPRAGVNHEPERTAAHGLQAAAHRATGRHDLTVGGDVFFEEIAAPSFSTNPATAATTVRRGRVPDGSRYRHGGAFAQDVFEAVPGRLRLNGAVRLSAASYEVAAAAAPSGALLWPSDAYDTRAVTFRLGARWTVAGPWSLAANVSRGFRAPDVTDLGTFGLTGSGYEVSNREVEGLGATVGTTADAARGEHRTAGRGSRSGDEPQLRADRALPLAPPEGGPHRLPDGRPRQRRQAVPRPAARGGRDEPRRRARHAPAAERRRVRRPLEQPRPRAHELRRGADPRRRGHPRRRARRVALPGRDAHVAARRGPRDRASPERRGRNARPRGLAPAALRPVGRPSLLGRALPPRRGAAGSTLDPGPRGPPHRRLALADEHRQLLHERRPGPGARFLGPRRRDGHRRRRPPADGGDPRRGAGTGSPRRPGGAPLPCAPRLRRPRRAGGGPAGNAPRDPLRPREPRGPQLPWNLVGHRRPRPGGVRAVLAALLTRRLPRRATAVQSVPIGIK